MAAPYAESWRSRRNTPRSTSCSKSPRTGALLLNHIVGDITFETWERQVQHVAKRQSRGAAETAEEPRSVYSSRTTEKRLVTSVVEPIRGSALSAAPREAFQVLCSSRNSAMILGK